MKTGDLDAALNKTNPWWRGPRGWELDDADLRRAAEAPFRHEPNVLEDLRPGGLYILRGPRRVGKTVEIKRAISRLIGSGIDPRRIIHAACDGWRDAEIGQLVDRGRRIATRGVIEPRYWFLDEVTAVKGDWPSRIKWLRDNDPFGEDCVVLTGSSMRGLDDAVKALAGRRGEVESSDRVLLPMSFGDLCRALGIALPSTPRLRPMDFQRDVVDAVADQLHPWCNDLVDAWEIHLRVGGFPRAVQQYIKQGDVDPGFVDSLWHVIHGEAIRSAEFAASQTQALLAELAARMGAPLNVARLAGEIRSSMSTTARRLRELEDAFLLWPCHQYDPSHRTPNLRSQSKVYFSDPLLARIAHLRNPDATPEPDLSTLSEQQIGITLLRAREHTDPGSYPRFDSVMYQTTPSRKEIDFVGGWMDGVPFESKYVDGAWRRDARTATNAYDGVAVLATRSVLDNEGRARAVPAPILALMLEP